MGNLLALDIWSVARYADSVAAVVSVVHAYDGTHDDVEKVLTLVGIYKRLNDGGD